MSLGLTLGSCTQEVPSGFDFDLLDKAITNNTLLTEDQRRIVDNHCVVDRFIQGQDDNLYGKRCIDGRHLFIQTSKEGPAIATSASISPDKNQVDGLRLEEKLDFKNKFYNPEYKILEEEGQDKNIPFLKAFLPLDKKFFGSLNTKYKIIFKIEGNYLILYKASKKLEDIPHTERAAPLEVSEDGYYMVPFIGYPIQHCNAERELNIQGQSTYRHKIDCDKPFFTKNAKYIKIYEMGAGKEYEYIMKKDLFPSNYFDGEWFFSEAAIETPNPDSKYKMHLPPSSAYLIKTNRTSNSLEMFDVSGKSEKRNQRLKSELLVSWQRYEMDRDGERFTNFGERLYEDDDPTKRPYVIIKKPLEIKVVEMIGTNVREKSIKLTDTNSEIIEVLVTKNYFSMTLQVEERDKTFKHKYSLLRKAAVDENNFTPRKWFKEDHDRYFGTLWTMPQTFRKLGHSTESELLANRRMIHFNTNNKQTPIKWFFSKNSTKDNFYRDIAREAVQIYNQAFQNITKGTKKKVELVLGEEEKDLGDPRYNIFNLVKTQDTSRSILIGYAPSFVNQNTGQIIGTTVNIYLNFILELAYQNIRQYVRYEIFQKSKKTKKEGEIHVISSHFRSQIEDKCSEVIDFINEQKNKFKEKLITPRSELNDRNIILPCSQAVSRNEILATVLHEMGHSFGLAHNFKGSIDKDNYYKSIEEIRKYFPHASLSLAQEIPKSSSVMDYWPVLDHPALTVLGKYDLAALKFLYMDQIETKKEGDVALVIHKDPSQQKPLSQDILAEKKNYLHCSDSMADRGGENFLCLKEDHGSTPLEITTNYINKLKQYLNTRYRYDAKSEELKINVQLYFEPIQWFYVRWIRLRDQYLNSNGQYSKSKYIISEENENPYVRQYKEIIERGLGKKAEYDLYYQIREPIFDLSMYLLFLKTMKCEVVKDNNNENFKFDLDLEWIKQILLYKYGKDMYVEDCNSEMITQFFKDNDLTLVGQKGVENFRSGSYSSIEKSDKIDVISLSTILTSFNSSSNPYTRQPSLLYNILQFASEPDLVEEFRLELENYILNNKDESMSGANAKQLFYIYNSFNKKLSSLLADSNDKDILLNNNRYFHSITYPTGTQSKSFHEIVERPLREGTLRIKETEIPFLIREHGNYTKQSKSNIMSFQDYLVHLNTTMDNTDRTSSFTIPFRKNSFSEQMIVKYNKNLEEIQKYDELEKTRGLTDIETLYRVRLRVHNKLLFNLIQISIEDNI